MKTASSIARAMQSFVIEGGRPLSGTVRASGNKNGALPILAACVLASEEVRLSNVPRIRDVETMVELLADLGADVEWTGSNDVRVDASGMGRTDLDAELAREIRASFLLAGPLLARFGRVSIPPPGGDVIGRRRLDTHVHAFAALGADVADRRRLRALDRRPARHARVPRRSLRHGHGERDHGRRARRRRDGPRPRGLRAAHPGSLPLPRIDRRGDRGHRLERPAHHRASPSSVVATTGSARTTSRSRRSSASRPRRAARSW